MTNKPYQDNGSQSEYTLPEENNENISSPNTIQSGPLKAYKIKPKFLMIILVVIGFIFIISIVRHIADKKESVPAKAKIQFPVERPMVTPIPVMVTPPPVIDTAALKQSKINAEAIAQLQQAMQATQNQLDSINQSLSSMSQQLNTLSASTQDLSRTITNQMLEKARKEKEEQQAKGKQEAELRHQKQYYVQAVIPGRVWLRSIGGQTMTVSVGDTLPGYGKITAIDSYSGMVKTSSGITIQYAQTES